MTSAELRAAVEDPARAAGLEVEPGVVEAIVADAGREPGALPLVSTALLALWERRHGRRLTLAGYHQSGGVRGAVAQLGETTYTALTSEQKLVARRTLLRLGDVGDGGEFVRTRVPIIEVAPPDDHDARVVLDTLADRRLLTVSGDTVEVAHEALLREWPRLRGWLEEDEAGRALRAHLGPSAREWEERGRDQAELYRGPRLITALEWAGEHNADLTPTERAFLDKSKDAADLDALQKRRTIRRLRVGAVGLAALLVAATSAGFVAVQQRDRADAATVASNIRALEAKAAATTRWDLAVLYAAQAQKLQGEGATGLKLLETLQRSSAALGVLPVPEWTNALGISPDGSLLVAGGANTGIVYAWDTKSRQLRSIPAPQVQELTLPPSFSGDGQHVMVSGFGGFPKTGTTSTIDMTLDHPTAQGLAVPGVVSAAFVGRGMSAVGLFDDGTIHSVDTVTARVGPAWESPGTLGNVTTWPLESMLADVRNGFVHVNGPGHTLIWDAATSRFVGEVPHQGALLGPDGVTAAFADDDGKLVLFDVRSGQERRSGSDEAAVSTLMWSPDGTRLVTGSTDRAVRVWDVSSLTPVATFRGHVGSIQAFASTADGKTLYSLSLDRAIFAWDLTGQRRLAQTVGPSGNSAPRVSQDISTDGRVLASVLNDDDHWSVEVLIQRGATTDRLVSEFPIEVVAPNDTTVDPTGRWAAFIVSTPEVAETRVGQSHVFVFDVQRRRFLPYALRVDLVVPCPRAKCGIAGAVNFSPDGSTLFVATGPGVIRTWDTESGRGGAVVLTVTASRGSGVSSVARRGMG